MGYGTPPPGSGTPPPPPGDLAQRGPRLPGVGLGGSGDIFSPGTLWLFLGRLCHPPQPHPVTTASAAPATRTQPGDRWGPAVQGHPRVLSPGRAGWGRSGPGPAIGDTSVPRAIAPQTWGWGHVCPQGHCTPDLRMGTHLSPGPWHPRPADGNATIPRSLAPLGDTSVPKAMVMGPHPFLAQGHPWTGRSLGGHWAGTRGHHGPWEPWGPRDRDLASPIPAWGPILHPRCPCACRGHLSVPHPSKDPPPCHPQGGDMDMGIVPSATSAPSCPLIGDGFTVRAGGARAPGDGASRTPGAMGQGERASEDGGWRWRGGLGTCGDSGRGNRGRG